MKLNQLLREQVKIDNKDGWGAVPNNQDVDYFGLRVNMKPSTFIQLAAPLDTEPSSEIKQHIKSGGAIGAPFLDIMVPEDLDQPAQVISHEGRNRMIAIQQLFGDIPVEVHLFFSGKVKRNRNLTDEIVQYLNKGLQKEDSNRIIHGPLFTV